MVTIGLRVSCIGLQTGASRKPATGSQSGSDPVAASEEEHPLHKVVLYPRRASRPKCGAVPLGMHTLSNLERT